MKILNQILQPVKKFSKGILALFLIGSLLLTASIVIRSCKKDGIYTETTNPETEKLLSLFKTSIQKAGSIIKGKTIARSGEGTNPYYAPIEEDALTFVNEIESSALSLIKSYGVTEQQLVNELSSLHPGKIALVAELILKTENLIDNGQTLPIFIYEDYSLVVLNLFGIHQASAQKNNVIALAAEDTFGGCLMDAVRIAGLAELDKKGIKGLGKKGIMKLVRKVAGKALEPIGVTLAAYDFANCINCI